MGEKEQRNSQSKKRKQIPNAERGVEKSTFKKPKSVQSKYTNFPKKELMKTFKSPFKHKEQSEKPNEPKSKREARLQSKAETEAKKKKRKKNYDLQHELAALWEKMRRHNIAKEDRSKMVSEAVQKMKGKIPEIAMSHVSSRVLQTCVKYCTQPERDAIFKELQPDLLTLARNAYSVHLVKKMLDNASKKQLEGFISALHGHVASLLRLMVGSVVVEHAYQLGNASQRQNLLFELYSTEFQLFKDLASSKEKRLVDVISNLGLSKPSVLRHMYSVIQPILEKGIVDHSIIHTALLEYLTIADKSSATDVIEQLSGPLLVRMIHTRDGSKLGVLCIKNGGAKARKKIVKGMKGHIGKIAQDQYGNMVLVCLLSTVDDTKLATKIVVRELQEALKELVSNKSGRRPLLQLLHPNCRRYFGMNDLDSLNINIPSLCCNKGEGSELTEQTELLEISDDKDVEKTSEGLVAVPDDGTAPGDGLQLVGGGKKDPAIRRLELLVNSGLAESLVDTCIESVGDLLKSNFGKEIIYEVATGAAGGILRPTLDGKLDALHRAIASVAALPKPDDLKQEHILENFHSSRTLRKLVMDCPTFASTLWKTALKGKCETWAKGPSAKVVSAFLESSDTVVQDLAKPELQPLLDAGFLTISDNKTGKNVGC